MSVLRCEKCGEPTHRDPVTGEAVDVSSVLPAGEHGVVDLAHSVFDCPKCGHNGTPIAD